MSADRPDPTGRLRILREAVGDAFANLNAMRQRSLLALIGIVIGTAAVIAMVNIGNNARREFLRQFETMGIDILLVQTGMLDGLGHDAGLRADDLRDLPSRIGEVEAVAPVVLGGAYAVLGGRGESVSVVAATAALADIARLSPSSGRFVSDFDGSKAFAVVGRGLAESFAGKGRLLRLGDGLQMGDAVFTVIGLLPEVIPNPMLTTDFNRGVIIPLESARRVGAGGINNVILRMRPGADDRRTAAAVQADVQALLGGRPVDVQSARQLIEGMGRQMRHFSLLLAAIGGVSIVVGGVGVMNVMLMSVMERRREIGIRLAVGARQGDIRAMFLIEALSLSLAGGLLGTASGLAAAAVVADVAAWTFILAPGAVPLGLGVSAATGLFFGIYPAVKAARLDPVAALRAD